ncbi:M23 family metallopeptidase [Williamwhitmania taraxaci]|uniref:Peptidase family M23 n=1 Tax=Williamwhitmania taraxaci TaxID=1640674 RepID=A0A1G6R064_9BACT|nr:M23 family metallopeptidase [Williamwhitmania taraxaci]SDC97938.1 Peptidase family M23 [Williamwhitmania taraxaci]
MAQKEKKRYLSRLKNKYRFSIYNDQTFEEVWFLRLSRLNVMAVFGGFSFLLVSLVIVLIAFTPLREFIPGYPDTHTRRQIVQNALKVDSLERKLDYWQQYLTTLQAIVNGENPPALEAKLDTTIRTKQIVFTKSVEDSVLRTQIENNEQYNLSVNTSPTDNTVKGFHFFPPVRGEVTSSFNLTHSHFGTDIASAPNEVVVAVLEGTVTMATWTLETGYVIQIQHNGNLLSVYKHNSKLLKKAGSHVKAGEAIAIVGNSGELTTGPHLHFELWFNGTPVDAEKYIVF